MPFGSWKQEEPTGPELWPFCIPCLSPAPHVLALGPAKYHTVARGILYHIRSWTARAGEVPLPGSTLPWADSYQDVGVFYQGDVGPGTWMSPV